MIGDKQAMIDTEQQAICKREGCTNPIEQKAIGPYKREYCSNACKQAVYRASHRNVTIDAEAQQRIAELERDLAEANEFIEKHLAGKKSNSPVKRGLQEKLTRLLEQRGWPALDIHYRVNPGQKEGRVFIIGASIELLSRALNQLEAQRS
jgi:hypothetical protein